ncbi:MAG TPA: SUMF1/EgtB/PvdO family nonheme iron enzyme [Myxococcota bacterium]|nr:SUMF1/EgtB/PvdO family nonheme iron enzyme [Myxococcota bacterium]
MGTIVRVVTLVVLLALGESAAQAQGSPCPADSVRSGTVCMDEFEASVWRVPSPTTTSAGLVAKIRQGTATAADLAAGGATQLGVASDDYAPCADDGQNCADDIYAVAIPSVAPAASITWFQAQEACANSGKRLPTNAEWQGAANGTPDPGPDNGTTDCNTASGAVPRTGDRANCVSSSGAFDMVGGVAEWVAEWVPRPTVCTGWASFSDDDMCLAGADTTQPFPAALVRGGAFTSLGGVKAGPLALHPFTPNHSSGFIGFRCVR